VQTGKLPHVDVILPCYNSARFLVQTLRGILSQRYPNLSIIAVDDGSTDGTLEILRSFPAPITVVTHPGGGNRGQSASTNLGIAQASGDLVAFLDHDDVWFPDKLWIQVGAFQRNPDLAMVAVNAVALDEHGDSRFNFPDFPSRPDPVSHSLLQDCFIQTPSQVMVRREVLERVGGYADDLVAAADHDLWLRICEQGPCKLQSHRLVGYRLHESQLSVARNRRMWEDAVSVLRRAVERFDYPMWLRRRRSAVLHYRLGECDIRDKLYWSAILHLAKAAILDPGRAIRELKGRLLKQWWLA